MRILFIHSFYQQFGGEDAVFQQETNLLRGEINIDLLTASNKPGLRGAVQFFSSIWNIRAAGSLRARIRASKPDIIHIHNFHFAFGPIIIWTAKKAGIKIVMTLHNFRLICPSAILMENGQIFTDSILRDFPWKAIGRGVYRNSIVLTFWLAVINWLHRKFGTWQMVDKYIVLTEASKKIFAESTFNISESKFKVKPNFVFPATSEVGVRASHFLFVGRLTEEKGIRTLLEAFQQTNHKVSIAGHGPLQDEVIRASKAFHNITYLGNLQKEEVQREMRQCTALIFPSIWFEGMPMTIIEAFSTGTPVLSSDIGAMSSMIQNEINGLHFHPADVQDLVKKIDYWMALSENQKTLFQGNAYASYKQLYTPEANMRQLLDIYRTTINNSSLSV